MQFTFEPKSKEEWLSKITSDLKGKLISDLNWNVSETITMSPFAHADDIKSVHSTIVDRPHNKWYINEEIIVGDDVSQSNALALIALQSGASSLSFQIDSPCDFEELFNNINLEWIYIHLEAQSNVINQFVQYIKESSLDTHLIRCSFKLNTYNDSKEILKTLPLAKFYGCASMTTDHTPEKEIADLLVQATKHLQHSTEPQGNAQQIYFTVNLTDSFYLNIAKIRALKLLWANVLESSKIQSNTAFIKAQMSTDSFSEDVDYTKIKAGAQAIAAAIASVDLIHILPSSQSDKVDFHTRIARNVNHLLQLESFMDRVVDPAAGSYYLEQLTDKVAEAAWVIFQQTFEHQQ